MSESESSSACTTKQFRLWCDYQLTKASLVAMAQEIQTLEALVVSLFTTLCVHDCLAERVCVHTFNP